MSENEDPLSSTILITFIKYAKGLITLTQWASLGHALNRGKYAAHQQKCEHKEKGHKHNLLLVACRCRNKQPQAQCHRQVYRGKGEQQQEIPFNRHGIHKFTKGKSKGEFKKGNDPKREPAYL